MISAQTGLFSLIEVGFLVEIDFGRKMVVY
jgi:hypothetical protein